MTEEANRTIDYLTNNMATLQQNLRETEFKYISARNRAEKLELKLEVQENSIAKEKDKLEYLQQLLRANPQIISSIPLAELKPFRGRLYLKQRSNRVRCCVASAGEN